MSRGGIAMTTINRVAIFGAGKIGALISCLLAQTKDYQLYLVDIQPYNPQSSKTLDMFPEIQAVTLDINDGARLKTFLQQQQPQVILSCLPYFCNVVVATAAHAQQIHYFDLTEDTSVTAAIKELSVNTQSAFVPQCGLAPGYVGMIAYDLMQRFDKINHVKLRAGALPQYSSNALQYALTWSTEGLINEYANVSYGIEQSKATEFEPLQGLEAVQIDGLSYEAFHTSGGLGSLAALYGDQVCGMDYKTLRYPGHCEKMRVLMQDLQLNENRDLLKKILERVIPRTFDDVVIVYITVTGYQAGIYTEESYVNKIYPKIIAEQRWSAIQIATAGGICGVLDYLIQHEKLVPGFVYQEQVPLAAFVCNRFGRLLQRRV